MADIVYTKYQLEKDIEYIDKMKERLVDIVYAPQEAQVEHFDNLPKSERFAIYGIFHDVSILVMSLHHYQDYFKSK